MSLTTGAFPLAISHEDDLRESDAYFRVLTESLPQLVWTCSSDGRCDYLSKQWVAYTGIPADDQLGLRWLDRIHPEDRGRTQVSWFEAVSGGGNRFNSLVGSARTACSCSL